MRKCLVIGSTVCDVVIRLDKIPLPSQGANVDSQSFNIGGCAFNVADVLHHLDIPYTLISPIGTGAYGEFVRQAQQERGVLSHVHVEAENGCCYCLVEKSGERTFLSYHGAEYTFQSNWLDSLSLDDYEYIYICGLEIEEESGWEVIRCLSRFQGTIIYAPSSRCEYIEAEKMHAIFQRHPILHLNQDEAFALSGENDPSLSARKLFAQTQNIVIITLGSEGVYYYDGFEELVVKSEKTNVVDTIGAGDSHIGAVIACMYKKLPIRQVLLYANQIAGMVVSCAGANLEKPLYEAFKKNVRW